MNKLIILIYSLLPKSLIRFIGSAAIFKRLRNFFLREGGHSRTVTVLAKWPHDNLQFQFRSDFRTSVKVLKHPIEGTLLKLSLDLLDYGKSENNKVIFDVGASFGYLTLVWAKTISSNGRVYSFEANPHVFNCLRENILLNELKEIAFPFNKPIYSSSVNLPITHGPSASNINLLNSASTDPKANELSAAISIDDFVKGIDIDRVDLIKIDIDGPDLEALKGAVNTLKRFEPIVIVEFDGNQTIVALMKELSYQLFDFKLTPFTGQPAINLICLPASF